MNNHSDTLQNEYEKTFRRNAELEELVATLAKEARAALVLTNVWQQEFQGNEIVGIIAMYLATKKVVAQKEAALSIAIDFIGKCESWNEVQLSRKGAFDMIGEEGFDALCIMGECLKELSIKSLEDINQSLASETIAESIKKKERNIIIN